MGLLIDGQLNPSQGLACYAAPFTSVRGNEKKVESICLITLGCAIVDGQRISSLRYHCVACWDAQEIEGWLTTGWAARYQARHGLGYKRSD